MKKHHFIGLTPLSVQILTIFFVFELLSTGAAKQPNVLLIVCDDLNDYVSGFGGHSQAKTPAVEKLAASGTLFTRAYCNSPVCVPSRNSFINGLYPHSGTISWKPWNKDETLRDSKTMMAYFRDNGYYVVGSGKIDHYSITSEWSKYYDKADYGPFWHKDGENVAHPDVPAPFNSIGAIDGSYGAIEDALDSDPNSDEGWYYAAKWKKKAKPMVQDSKLGWMTPDKKNAHLMKRLLTGKEDEGLKEPFFMAVGFIRPHTPLHVEKKFFDMYPIEDIKLEPIKENDAADTHLKDIADRKTTKGYKYYDMIGKSYSSQEEGLKHFNQAYLASVCAVDANIETVLTALDKSRYKQNTIVVMVSDHGWQMGEKEWMFKGSPWEESCRIPMIIMAPGITKPGTRCDHPVSLIDIYPTLADLCGLTGSTVAGPAGKELDGHSMKPFLKNPKNGEWEGPDFALTACAAKAPEGVEEPNEYNHYSLRTKDYRYIRYGNGKEELYNHAKDPYEWTNLAGHPEHKEVKERMFQKLRDATGYAFQ